MSSTHIYIYIYIYIYIISPLSPFLSCVHACSRDPSPQVHSHPAPSSVDMHAWSCKISSDVNIGKPGLQASTLPVMTSYVFISHITSLHGLLMKYHNTS